MIQYKKIRFKTDKTLFQIFDFFIDFVIFGIIFMTLNLSKLTPSITLNIIFLIIISLISAYSINCKRK